MRGFYMIYSENEILQYIDENDVKFVKLTFCDLSGQLKNISVLSSEMAAVFEHGVKIAGKKLCGFGCAGGRDLFLFTAGCIIRSSSNLFVSLLPIRS